MALAGRAKERGLPLASPAVDDGAPIEEQAEHGGMSVRGGNRQGRHGPDASDFEGSAPGE